MRTRGTDTIGKNGGREGRVLRERSAHQSNLLVMSPQELDRTTPLHVLLRMDKACNSLSAGPGSCRHLTSMCLASRDRQVMKVSKQS